MVTVAWHKCCKPFAERGLGLRSITKLNEASNMKLCWEMLTSDEDWCKLIRSRVLRGPDKKDKSNIMSSIPFGVELSINFKKFSFIQLG